MYRASLTRLVRSVSALQGQRFCHSFFLQHIGSSYLLLPAESSSVRPSRYFSKTSFYQDNNVITQSSNASGHLEEALREVICAMTTVPGLLEIYENFKDSSPMDQRNRISLLYSITNLTLKDQQQKDLLTSETSPDGKKNLFLELLDQITKHISESGGKGLSLIMWSVGKVGGGCAKTHALVRTCEGEILSRDITSFDHSAVNQILSGLIACNLKDSPIWSKMENSVLMGEIQICDFSNTELVGSLLAFSKSWNVSSKLFECYREALYSRELSSFKDYELSQLVYAFATKGIEAEKLYSHTEQEILQKGLKSFISENIFLIPLAFAKCNSDRRYDQIFQLIDEEIVLRDVQELPNDFLATLVWCFSKVGMYDAKVYNVVKDEVLVRGVASFQGYFRPLIWSFARADQNRFVDLSEQIATWFLSIDIESVNKHHLCFYTWCFQRLRIRNEMVYQAIEKELLRQNFSGLQFFHLNQLLSGFAFAKTGSSEFLQHVEAAVLKFDFSTLKASQIVSLVKLFAELDHETSGFYDAAKKELLRQGATKVASKELRKLKKRSHGIDPKSCS